MNSLPISPVLQPLSAGRDRHAQIAVARTWALLFVRESGRALKGLTHQMPRAAAQTYLAIEQIDPEPLDDLCKCGHWNFWHEGTAGGICLTKDCPCGLFTK